MEGLVPDIYSLQAHVQHYAWGDTDAIPHILHIPNSSRKPYAELWMGAHPDLPSEMELDGSSSRLDHLIEQHPIPILGKSVADRFDNRLPFLLKLLAAAEPLSIQVHPSKHSAEAGFLRENEAGVPMDAFHRNYKDDNHKPELLMAMVPFFGLRGFRPFEEIKTTLGSVPEFRPFAQRFASDSASLRTIFEMFMRLEDEAVQNILHPIIGRLKSKNEERPFTKTEREYWVLRSDAVYAREGRHDRGLFAIFLLNLVCLQPGQAMYLPAGVLHAYLEGMGMELMANSNNVLRSGLTPKHLDVNELIKEVNFQGECVEILNPVADLKTPLLSRYVTSASEFELQRLEAKDTNGKIELTACSPEILFSPQVSENEPILIQSERKTIRLTQPKPVLICCEVNYTVELPEGVTLFRALVPMRS